MGGMEHLIARKHFLGASDNFLGARVCFLGATDQADINCGTAGPAVRGQATVAMQTFLESKINLG